MITMKKLLLSSFERLLNKEISTLVNTQDGIQFQMKNFSTEGQSQEKLHRDEEGNVIGGLHHDMKWAVSEEFHISLNLVTTQTVWLPL